MSTHNDVLIGRIALERAYLNEEQLLKCLQEQVVSPDTPLGTIMLRRGFIKPPDLESLLQEQKKRLAEILELSDPKLEDALLGRLLIKQGLAREAQIYECLRVQAEMGERGQKAPRLGTLLVRRGYLTTDAVDTAMLMTRQDKLICPSCGTKYSAQGIDATKDYTCKTCGSTLEHRSKMLYGGQTTGNLKIDLPEDAIEAAEDPAKRFADGRYILVEESGRGGMGVVWRAWQTDLKRYVAIKILAGSLWTEDQVKRFYREARMAASLSHANIASVFEVGTWQEKHFIAMEYVEGTSLSEMMSSASTRTGSGRHVRHLSARKAASIIREAALAADYAHANNIIHRDLKPHNIMVGEGGRVYVMDFGLAKPVRAEKAITVSDAIVGTPQYMSPEQARGDKLDRRADVYSLGAVLYHVTTGRPPFEERSTAETLMSVLADDPQPPRRLNPRIHIDLETIILKALEKDRASRYPSAKRLAEDLGRFLDGEPIQARPRSARASLWKAVQQRPLQAVGVAVAFCAIVLFAGILGIMHLSTRSTIDGNVRRAEFAFKKGDFEEARTYWERVLALAPSHAAALRGRKDCIDKIAEQEKALLARAGNRDREIRDWLRKGDEHFRAGRYAAALIYYGLVVQADPENPEAGLRIADCETAAAGEQEKVRAREELETTVRERMQSRLRAQPYYEVARQLDRAIAVMKPADGFTIQEIMDGYARAREKLTTAVQEDDSYTEAWFFRGQIRHKMGDYDLALQDYREALRTAEEFPPARFAALMTHLAKFMIHGKTPYVPDLADRGTSQAEIERLAKLVHNTSASMIERFCARALAAFHQRDYAEALRILDNVELESVTYYPWHFTRACIHLEAGDEVAALGELEEALTLEPVSYEAQFLRAWILVDQEEFDKAFEAVNVALEPAQRRIHTGYLLRAHIQEQKDDRAAALADLEQAALLAGPRAKAVRNVIEAVAAEKQK